MLEILIYIYIYIYTNIEVIQMNSTDSILKTLPKSVTTIVLGGANNRKKHLGDLIIDKSDKYHEYIDNSYFLKGDFTDKTFIKHIISIVGKGRFKKIIADTNVIKMVYNMDTELFCLYGELLETGGILCLMGAIVNRRSSYTYLDGEHEAKSILSGLIKSKKFTTTALCFFENEESKKIPLVKRYGKDKIIEHNAELMKKAGFDVKYIINFKKKNKNLYPLNIEHAKIFFSDIDYYLATKK